MNSINQVDEKTYKDTDMPLQYTLEDATSKSEGDGVDSPALVLSDAERKKLLRRVDLRTIPALMFLYVFSYIDRANIGNARIEGMQTDLHLTGSQYNIVLSMFFVTYIIFEIPSNIVLETWFRTRPSRWLCFIAVMWGVMMTLHGIVQNYGGILTVRLLMGAFEAGLFPGAIALLSKWYTKYELATRLSLFYVGSALAGAFSGILAYGLAKMDGVAGLQGWRWIFIIEGIITTVLGASIPFLLTDIPETRPKWLSTEECDYLIQRMVEQNGGEEADKAGKHLSWSLLWEVVTDWQYYPLIFSQWSNTVPTYGLKFTLPTIIKNMGFTASNAQLLSIPPYVAGGISALTFGLLSDKFKRRSIFLLIQQTLLLVAYSVLTSLAPHIKSNIGACYFAIVLANIGCYGINPGTSTWCSNNTPGTAKRSVALAFMISMSSIGGIFSSYMYIESQAPGYPVGFGLSLGFAAAGAVAVIILDVTYTRINKKRDKLTPEQVYAMYTPEQLGRMSNKSPLFRYVV